MLTSQLAVNLELNQIEWSECLLTLMHFDCFMNAFAAHTNSYNGNALNASFLYACLLGHSAVRQTELRLAIRLSHLVLLHHDILLGIFFMTSF